MTYIVVSLNEIVKAEMERPVPLPSEFAAPSPAMQLVINNYKDHCLSLPRIAIQGEHNWEVWQEVEEGKDFTWTKCSCKIGSDCPTIKGKWLSPCYVAIPIQPTPEGEKVEDYYPGYQYQRLFNAIHSTGGTALQGEMDEIIRIVHKDFPLNNDNTQTP